MNTLQRPLLIPNKQLRNLRRHILRLQRVDLGLDQLRVLLVPSRDLVVVSLELVVKQAGPGMESAEVDGAG